MYLYYPKLSRNYCTEKNLKDEDISQLYSAAPLGKKRGLIGSSGFGLLY
jgi:hypothetical protein